MADILDRYDTQNDNPIATGGNCAFASRFTPTVSGYIPKVEFLLKSATGTATVATAELWSMSGANMGTKISTIEQLNLSSVPSTATWYEFKTAGTDATITASTQYSLVITTTAPSGKYIHVLAHNAGGTAEHYSTAIPPVTWGTHGQIPCFKQYYYQADTSSCGYRSLLGVGL